MAKSTFKIKEKIWIWPGESANWFFVYVDGKVAEQIREQMRGSSRRGFGAVKVEVTLGESKWRTSVFPTKEGPYVLPIKASIRKAEKVSDGSVVDIALKLI